MESTLETDKELEDRARAQAAAIAEAQALALTEEKPMTRFFDAVGRAFGVRQPRPPSQPSAVMRPGRELLLWQMMQSSDASANLRIAFALLDDPRFLATVPADRECLIATYQARRKWNEAAKEWSEQGGDRAQAWLRCDRRLMIVKHNAMARMCMSVKDLYVRFDKRTEKLEPVRVEGVQPLTVEHIKTIVEKFPSLTANILTEGMRLPTRAFGAVRARGAPDAYIANGPLMPGLEVFMQDKKRKKEAEDPNKGIATWLASLLKSSAMK